MITFNFWALIFYCNVRTFRFPREDFILFLILHFYLWLLSYLGYNKVLFVIVGFLAFASSPKDSLIKKGGCTHHDFWKLFRPLNGIACNFFGSSPCWRDNNKLIFIKNSRSLAFFCGFGSLLGWYCSWNSDRRYRSNFYIISVLENLWIECKVLGLSVFSIVFRRWFFFLCYCSSGDQWCSHPRLDSEVGWKMADYFCVVG